MMLIEVSEEVSCITVCLAELMRASAFFFYALLWIIHEFSNNFSVKNVYLEIWWSVKLL